MSHAGGRACQSCGTRLAADNRTTRCGPCSRAFATGIGPPEVENAFWDDEAIATALAERDFGRFLRAYRHGHNIEITQSDLARWLGLTQGQVSRIERGLTRTHDLDKLTRWASILRIPQQHLWFTLDPQTSDAYSAARNAPTLRTPTPDEGDDLRRRQFLTSASVAVGATLLRAQPAAAAAARPDHPALPPDREIREMTQRFRRLDNRYGGGHSRTVVTSYLTSIVDSQLKHVRGDDGAQAALFSAAAEMHQLAGWMSYDVGQPADGKKHLRTALHLCQQAGDHALVGEMFAGMSHHAAFHGAADSAVDLAIAARQCAGAVGLAALQAEAAVMEAHGHALLGDKQACLRALRDAETVFTSAGADRPEWLGYFDHAYLAAKFAHTFRDLGMPRDAEVFARRSLEMSDGYERGRLFNTALLASTLADQRRIEEACHTATKAVRMTDTVRSVRSAAYLADVGRRLAPFSTTSVVKTLYGRMADAGLPTPATRGRPR